METLAPSTATQLCVTTPDNVNVGWQTRSEVGVAALAICWYTRHLDNGAHRRSEVVVGAKTSNSSPDLHLVRGWQTLSLNVVAGIEW